MGSAIYLTGVPGTGKSTVAQAVAEEHGAAVFSYSDHLGAALHASRALLREQSAAVVTSEVVAAVDLEVVEFVGSQIGDRHVIIDSHAVTYEPYGFRVVPFKPPVLMDLRLDAIVCLTAPAEIIATRTAVAPGGRPEQSISRIEHAKRLQDSVALSYSLTVGIPLHVVDAEVPIGTTVDRLFALMERAARYREGTDQFGADAELKA